MFRMRRVIRYNFKVEMYQIKQNQMRNSLNIASKTKPGKKQCFCLETIGLIVAP